MGRSKIETLELLRMLNETTRDEQHRRTTRDEQHETDTRDEQHETDTRDG